MLLLLFFTLRNETPEECKTLLCTEVAKWLCSVGIKIWLCYLLMYLSLMHRKHWDISMAGMWPKVPFILSEATDAHSSTSGTLSCSSGYCRSSCHPGALELWCRDKYHCLQFYRSENWNKNVKWIAFLVVLSFIKFSSGLHKFIYLTLVLFCPFGERFFDHCQCLSWDRAMRFAQWGEKTTNV